MDKDGVKTVVEKSCTGMQFGLQEMQKRIDGFGDGNVETGRTEKGDDVAEVQNAGAVREAIIYAVEYLEKLTLLSRLWRQRQERFCRKQANDFI